MKALTFEEIDRPLEISNKPDLVEHPGQKLVMVKAAALNRRDYWITKGLYPGIQSGVTLGSDGAGICQGQDVVINPNVNWGQDPRLFDKTYSILGMPNDGTFAEYILVPEDRLVIKPHHLTYEQAAALPLGGLTAYRALFTKCNPRSGDKILISGVGGGVALFACQFAIAAGFETYVTSGSDEKIQQAISMGAAGGVNYKSEKWHNKLSEMTGGVDAVIDSAGGSGFNNLVKVCNPGARIAIYGGDMWVNRWTKSPANILETN